MLPKNRPPTHPGEMLLKEFIEPTGITQTKLAQHLKWPYARLNEIIKGKEGLPWYKNPSMKGTNRF